jgi:hypothetical protein
VKRPSNLFAPLCLAVHPFPLPGIPISFLVKFFREMTRSELQQYFEQLAQQYPLDPLYVPRRFTALSESGSVSDDLQYRAYGMLREREPALEELLTHPAIAIVADPGGGKSVVGHAAIHKLIADGQRAPVFAEIKQYRTDLPTLFRVNTPPAILNPAETVDNARLQRT